MPEHIIKPPWTEEQVKNLNNWQKAWYVHPFTCGGWKDGKDCGSDLIATKDGWICPNCSYTQDWCHDFMADGSLRSPFGKSEE